MIKLKVTQIGNSLGVILPKEALARLNVDKGDELYLTPAPDGYRITPQEGSNQDALEMGRAFMKRYRKTFRALAE
ncbi:MAG: AbrB/MazE/SpoVT family DNA-binding domain-containing protein [Caulobacterales bacterium]|jgi:putative addiction module antidote